jgi:hypothetical protein
MVCRSHTCDSDTPDARSRGEKARRIKNQLAGKHQTTTTIKNGSICVRRCLERGNLDADGKRQKRQNQFQLFSRRRRRPRSGFAFFSIFMQSEGLSEAHEIENLMHSKQLFLTPSLRFLLLTQTGARVTPRWACKGRKDFSLPLSVRSERAHIDTIN